MPESSFKYRADIDGLRALAILPVVFFHAGLPGFSGGFVGVDIFFVISGFLITGIILKEQAEERFTFSGFWARRARRIFPALGVVVLVSLVVGWFVLMPDDYRSLGRTAAAQAIFASNIDFYRNAGYFAPPADTQPLLHTWSLAVEEQFYLFFPLLMVVLGTYLHRWRIHVLAALFVGSLTWSAYQVGNDPSGAFYLMQYRAWELLAGGVLALWLSKSPVGHSVDWLDQLAAILGMAAIATTVFAYDRNTPFPGLAALLPCAGAVLLIWSNRGEPTLVGKWLSLRWVVWVGLISYSLYLWHWPVLVFSRYLLENLTTSFTVTALATSFLLAWLSYSWIETPVRRGRVMVSGRQLIVGSAALLFTFALAGTAIRLSKGVPDRLSTDARLMYQEAVRKPPPCQAVTVGDGLQLCERGVPGEAASLLVWGDSHARAMLPLIDQLAVEHSINYLIQGCVPVIDTFLAGKANGVDDYHCTKSNQVLFDYLQQQPVMDVLLIARWAVYVEGREVDAPDGSEADLFLGDRLIAPSDPQASRAVFAKQLPETVERLRATGAKVAILRQVPSQLFLVPNELARAIEKGHDLSSIGRPLVSHRKRQAFVDAVFDRLGDAVLVLDPAVELCKPDAFCRAAHKGRALYFDNDHLTEYGALHLRPVLEPIFGHGQLRR